METGRAAHAAKTEALVVFCPDRGRLFGDLHADAGVMDRNALFLLKNEPLSVRNG